jgi:hypothetical protein
VTSVPHAPAAQKLPRGSASLDLGTDPGSGPERARRFRALRLPRAHARENNQQHQEPTGRRRLRSRVHLTRARVLAAITLTGLSIAAVAIAAGGSPVHHSPIRSARASTSTTFPSLIDTFRSTAAPVPGIEGPGVRAQHHQRPLHRTHRPPQRRSIARPDASTGAPSSSFYTPRLTSQPDSSPALAVSSSASTSGAGGSSPATSSTPPTRTGPSGPISLIGAGTTPSG